jgi:hypothetical protein
MWPIYTWGSFMSEDQDQEERRVGTRWLISCTLLGLMVLALAVGGQYWWNWQGIWPAIVTNLGTALILATALFLLEPRFSGRVIRANQRAMKQVTSDIKEDIRQRTDELAARIDDLQGQVDQRVQEKRARRMR